MRDDKLLSQLSFDDVDFIYSAVEAGWTTPKIAREVDAPWLAVYRVSREARAEIRERLQICELCRRSLHGLKR